MSFTTFFSEFAQQHFDLTLDFSLDEKMCEAAKVSFKEDRYMLPTETSPQQALGRAAAAYGSTKEHAQRLYEYAAKNWFMFASPVLASAGNPRGQPVSCFLTEVEDSREGLANAWREMLWLATEGGGVGADYSSIRSVGQRTSRGTSTPGLMSFLGVPNAITKTSVQGEVRRGATAIYIDVSHPEIVEFVESRKVGGDENRKLFHIHNAVNIPDRFMEAVEAGHEWELIDPHSKLVVKSISARDLWDRILRVRMETGEPYLHFCDTSNRYLPQALKDKGLRINGSNLCSEIFLPTSAERTAVCVLSSVNIEYFDEWQHEEQFIPDILEMLDNVITVFTQKAPDELSKAVHSALNERSVGLGAMGFHLYLQKRGIPFESAMASSVNRRVFEHIHTRALKTNYLLGHIRGEAPDLQTTLTFEFADGAKADMPSSTWVQTQRGRLRAFEVGAGDIIDTLHRGQWEIQTNVVKWVHGAHSHQGRRLSHMIAIAPNASSAILCGTTSPGIELYTSNLFTQKKGRFSFVVKNKQLDKLLQEKYHISGKQLDDVWGKILLDEGSVQNLSFMEASDKEVFKTAREIDQAWVIEHASVRQPFICQGQSVNLFVNADTKMSYLRSLHKAAWKKGLKALYYLRAKNLVSMTGTSGKSQIDPMLGCISCGG